VHTGLHSCISLWVRGIPDQCDARDVIVRLGDLALSAVFVSGLDPEGRKQVNALVPMETPKGKTNVMLECSGRSSAAFEIELL
ncbi:MAG: hypothetical protein ABI824_14585, partial [Acidobacteriota bacterium]